MAAQRKRICHVSPSPLTQRLSFAPTLVPRFAAEQRFHLTCSSSWLGHKIRVHGTIGRLAAHIVVHGSASEPPSRSAKLVALELERLSARAAHIGFGPLATLVGSKGHACGQDSK
jgi:hypothetical protein